MPDAITWTPVTVRLDALDFWAHNPKRLSKAQAARLEASTDRLGRAGVLLIGPPDAAGRVPLYDGHQRVNVWRTLYGLSLEVHALQSDRPLTEAERLSVSLLTVTATGSLDFDALASWDIDLLQDLGLGAEYKAELDDTAANIAAMLDALTAEAQDNCLSDKNAQPNKRNLPIDVIFTWNKGMGECCIPVRGGMKYGIQSAPHGINGEGVCPYAKHNTRHAVIFVDNQYTNYDHEHHVAVVSHFRPKYATVCDIMTPEQCAKDNIPFFEFEQIMDWAAELESVAENVIIIPKYNCLDKIPSRYILGYSVPTSHGGTPLPVEIFKGRRVHLLGGSWKEQLRHMAQLGDDVVSLDNNHLEKITRWGQFYLPDGRTQVLGDVFGGYHINVRDICIALSVGAIGAKVNELYFNGDTAIEPNQTVAVTRIENKEMLT